MWPNGDGSSFGTNQLVAKTEALAEITGKSNTHSSKFKKLFAAGHFTFSSICTYMDNGLEKNTVNLMGKIAFSASWYVFLLKP